MVEKEKLSIFLFGTVAKRLGTLLLAVVIAFYLLLTLILFTGHCLEKCRLYDEKFIRKEVKQFHFKTNVDCFSMIDIKEVSKLLPDYLNKLSDIKERDFADHIYSEFWPKCEVYNGNEYIKIGDEAIFFEKDVTVSEEKVLCSFAKKLEKLRSLDRLCMLNTYRSDNSVKGNTCSYSIDCFQKEDMSACQERLRVDIISNFGDDSAYLNCPKIQYYVEDSLKIPSLKLGVDKACLKHKLVDSISKDIKIPLELIINRSEFSTKLKLTNSIKKCKQDIGGLYYEFDNTGVMFGGRKYCRSEGCDDICRLNGILLDVINNEFRRSSDAMIKSSVYYVGDTEKICTKNSFEECKAELKEKWEKYGLEDYSKYNSCVDINLENGTIFDRVEYEFNPNLAFSTEIYKIESLNFVYKVSFYLLIASIYLIILHKHFMNICFVIFAKLRNYIMYGQIAKAFKEEEIKKQTISMSASQKVKKNKAKKIKTNITHEEFKSEYTDASELKKEVKKDEQSRDTDHENW